MCVYIFFYDMLHIIIVIASLYSLQVICLMLLSHNRSVNKSQLYRMQSSLNVALNNERCRVVFEGNNLIGGRPRHICT